MVRILKYANKSVWITFIHASRENYFIPAVGEDSLFLEF
jgi:hypothetical protein